MTATVRLRWTWCPVSDDYAVILGRLTSPKMKTFISRAVSVAKDDPADSKLLNELNQHWVAALKADKQYKKSVDLLEQAAGLILKNAPHVSPEWLKHVRSMIDQVEDELKPIVVIIRKFERTEAQLIKKYPRLRQYRA
jgi:hypothetical protein